MINVILFGLMITVVGGCCYLLMAFYDVIESKGLFSKWLNED